MSRITLDETLRAKINDLGEEIEICDDEGRIIGYYVPAECHRKMLYAWAKEQFTDEELQAARRETGGRSLTEFWAELKGK
jgi:hypothetical protein